MNKRFLFAANVMLACSMTLFAVWGCGSSGPTMDVLTDSVTDISHPDASADNPDGTVTTDETVDTGKVDEGPVDDGNTDIQPVDDGNTDISTPDVDSGTDETIPVDPGVDLSDPGTDTQTCQPACDGRQCGADGCGGWCGWCAGGNICRDSVCVPYECAEGWKLIPAGMMNVPNPADKSGPPVKLIMTRAICVRETEVTNTEWLAISEYKGIIPSFDRPSPCLDCPVEQISWFDAVDYCNLLSKKEALESCVFLKNADGLPCSRVPSTGRVTGCKSGSPTSGTYMDCPGYRLPTRTEWLFAAMNGVWTSAFTGGNVSSFSWNNTNASGKKHSVKQLTPTEPGLYDMLGNVWEIVWDASSIDITSQPTGVDPTGPAVEGGIRLRMGGSFFANPTDLWPPPASSCTNENSGDLATGLRPVYTAL